ncbi:MAG: hypothetical protein Q8S55_11340 [Methylococcaceae bacterium]|nr:hypothetical protein [Methylococcaceae bacterium]
MKPIELHQTKTIDIAIKVKKQSKCYHIDDNPRDRLKQFVIPEF